MLGLPREVYGILLLVRGGRSSSALFASRDRRYGLSQGSRYAFLCLGYGREIYALLAFGHYL